MAKATHYGDQDTTAFADRGSERVENMAERASDQIRQMADRATSAANKVSEQGREASERVQEVAGNLKGAVDKSIKDQPMATLAMAAVAGFVLGALWKR
jgi:ElaB/YqjD/DUF883 family membrane-anchored ribosome-binding protein